MTSLFKESTITLVARLASFAVAMGTSIIIARMLGPTVKGSYALFLLTINVLVLFVLWGLGSANVYYGAKDKTLLPSLTGNSILAACVFGLVNLGLVEIFSRMPAVQEYYLSNHIELTQIKLFTMMVPVLLLQNYLVEIVRAAGNILHYNLLNFWRAVIAFAMVLALVGFYRQTLSSALIAWALAITFTALPTLVVALKESGWRIRLSLSLLGQSFKFGGRLYPGNIAQFLNYRLDIFLVGFFLSPFEIGIYTTATGLAEKLWEFPHAIRTVLLYRVASESEDKRSARTTMQVTRFIAVFMALICVVLAVFSYPLIFILYGSEYLSAAWPLVFLMPGVWALSIGKLLSIHLAGIGKPEIATAGAFISLIVTVVLDLILIPRIGILGAATASSIAYTISTIFYLIAFLNITQNRFRDVLFIKATDIQIVRKKFGRQFNRLSKKHHS
jgi:O-antigen/teichoic acid export membrane protein